MSVRGGEALASSIKKGYIVSKLEKRRPRGGAAFGEGGIKVASDSPENVVAVGGPHRCTEGKKTVLVGKENQITGTKITAPSFINAKTLPSAVVEGGRPGPGPP